MQFELGADHVGGEFGVGGGTSSTAVNVGGDVVDFLAILVGNDGALCGSRIRTQNNPVLQIKEERFI
jgi:hypothetical protein